MIPADLLRLGLTCNERCLFCTVANDPDRDLTTEEAKERIRYLAKNGSGVITFTGGEPTIREDLPELISFAKSKGIKKVELQSNGIKLSDEKYLKILIDSGLDYVLVALHSHIPEVSDFLTQVKGSFYKTTKGLKNLNNSELEVHISHVINSKNYKDLVEFVKFVKINFPKINFFYFGFVRPNGRCFENSDIVPKIWQIEPFLYEVMNYCKKNNIGFEVEGIPLCYMQKFEAHCSETLRLGKSAITYMGRDQHKDLHRFIKEKLKKKSFICKFCINNNKCVGVWEEYFELNGINELFPVFR